MTATNNNAEASASSSATAELLRSEWNDKGQCSNPEVIAIAKMPKGAHAKILLGVDPEGRWRAGYEFANGAHGGSAKAPNLSTSEAYADRLDAIHSALLVIARPFNENAKATKAIEAFHDAMKAAAAYANAVPGSLTQEVLADKLLEKEGRPLPKGRFEVLPVALVTPNPENHRKTFDPVAMQELQASLRQVGQLQPIAVRLLSPEELGELPGVGDSAPAKRYEIILGERRWRAHVGEGLENIEAKVYEGVTRAQAKAAALVENLQREHINPIEEAEGLADLIAAEGLTQEQCAIRVGRSRPGVANALRLLELPEGVREFIRAGKLTPAHGHALAKWKKRPLAMRAMAEAAIREGVPAGQLEDWNRSGGIPFQRDLERDGFLVIITVWNRPGGFEAGAFPEEILKHPDYDQREGGDQFVCWNPIHWREVVAREEQKIEAARAAAAAKAAKEKQKAKAKKVETVEDLPRGSYVYVTQPAQELAGLLPPDTIMTLPEVAKPAKGEDAEKSTVCLVPKFLGQVNQALVAIKAEDRMAKLPAILDKARLAVRKWKRLGPRELAVVTYILLDYHADSYGTPFIAKPCAVNAGLKVPALFAGMEPETYRSRFPEEAAKGLRTITDGDGLAYLRAIIESYLVTLFLEDPGQWTGENEPAADMYQWQGYHAERALPLLRHILNTDDLGLLEETRAGRRQIADKVKALDWYAPEFEKAKKAGLEGDGTNTEEEAA